MLADIRDRRAAARASSNGTGPDVVFHAAAHKHVPILERHPRRGRAHQPARHLVAGRASPPSTAASGSCTSPPTRPPNPCSVMGATKRAAELVVFEVGREHHLPYAAVRFGNVLGSRGSVVPTFLRQILDGGPVTVTDPEMTRYFMTIPEAVSLVLQAGAMADERQDLPARHGRAGVDHRPGPADDPAGRAAPRRRHRDRDHRDPARRAAARAAPRRRRGASSPTRHPSISALSNPRSRRTGATSSCFTRSSLEAGVRAGRRRAVSTVALEQLLRAVRDRLQLQLSRRDDRRTSTASPTASSSTRREANDAHVGRPSHWRSSAVPALRPDAAVRPPGPPAARAGRGAGASPRTTAACSPTARSSPSSRSASRSGSASPTSSRSARAPPA